LSDRDLEFWDDDEWTAFIQGWDEGLRTYFGSRLRTAQQGRLAETGVKPLQDFGIALFEIKHRCGARVVYTTEYATLAGCIYVLDAFMKDSREGKKMRTSDKTRIEARVSRIKQQMKPRLEQEARARQRKLH
jgi:phage-related protein